MKTHSPLNERIKRRYFIYLKEAQRYSEATVDAVAKALSRFETYNKFRDFKTFRFQQAVGFKKHLAEQRSEASGENLSKATVSATLSHLKRFFHWLAGEPGFKSCIQYSDSEYFNLSEKDSRIAKARRDKSVPTLKQINHVIAGMPKGTDVERRNRALLAFTLLTGARDSAIISMKLKHVDLVAGSVFQDAREVRTKFSKTFTTFFFPVGTEIRQIVVDWVTYLSEEKLWNNNDPLFPATKIVVGKTLHFEVAGLSRKHWSTATPIRAIFREAFTNAGLPYFNPHSFRNTLVRLGQKVCQTPEEFKAWSQNLGHEAVLTTFSSYGEVSTLRQKEIFVGLRSPKDPRQSNLEKFAKAVVHEYLTQNRSYNL